MGQIHEDDLYSEEEVLVEVIRVGGAVYCGQWIIGESSL